MARPLDPATGKPMTRRSKPLDPNTPIPTITGHDRYGKPIWGWITYRQSLNEMMGEHPIAEPTGRGTITPANPLLCSEHDNDGRTLDDHRAMVEWYRDIDNRGRDINTGRWIRCRENIKRVREARKAVMEPWPDRRGGTHDNSENLQTLMRAIFGRADIDTD